MVIAVEPSLRMIMQRPSGAAPVVQAYAEALPFPDESFDAALAILTVHHWSDRQSGLTELARVARNRVVILMHLPQSLSGFWLIRDYFPEIAEIEIGHFPTVAELQEAFGTVDVHPVPVPWDCSDGFLGAYWRRPEVYLDVNARRAISTFSKVGDLAVGLDALRNDLADGTWAKRNSDILDVDAVDLGYRLVVAEFTATKSSRINAN
jgi:SAM-dependent methyltransferase